MEKLLSLREAPIDCLCLDSVIGAGEIAGTLGLHVHSHPSVWLPGLCFTRCRKCEKDRVFLCNRDSMPASLAGPSALGLGLESQSVLRAMKGPLGCFPGAPFLPRSQTSLFFQAISTPPMEKT